MKDKISLNSRKSRIALILVLILLLQIIMPILKVEAESNTYDIKKLWNMRVFPANKFGDDATLIMYPGDIYNFNQYSYNFINQGTTANPIEGTVYRDGSIFSNPITASIIATNVTTYTIPNENYYYLYQMNGVGAGGYCDGDSFTTGRSWAISLITLNRIHFNYNGGSALIDDGLIKKGDSYSNLVPYGSTYYNVTNKTGLPSPTREGFVFDGWYTELEIGNPVINSTTFMGTDNNTILYAHWTPCASYSVNGDLTYTGEEQIGIIYDSETTNISGTYKATNVGDYTATLTPKDGYVWGDDKTTDARVVNWSISKQSLTIPTLTDTSKQFTGSEQAPTITGFDENTMIQTGTASTPDAGDYTITWNLKDTNNYKWSDDTITEKSETWSIAHLEVTIPTLSNTSKTYTGSEQAPTITGFDENTMIQTGTASTPDAGDYTITWSLKDKTNYKWSDGTTEDKSATWSISPIDITDEILKFEDNEVTYDTEEHSINITGELTGGTIEYSEDGQNFTDELPTYTNAGTYTIYYRAKKDNYNDKVGSNTLTINKKTITEEEIKEIVTIENQVYTEEKVEPEIVIKDGEHIVPNTEYTVEYSNNVKPGIANVEIKNVDGGNYIIETTELTFVIIEPGTVDYIEPETPNANNAKVTETPEEVIAKINLTEEDVDNIKHGKDIDVYLEVKDISSSIQASDKKAIEEKLGKDNLGLYLDVSLFKKIEGEDPTKITETKEPITISFELPDELINNNSKVERTYKVLRLHDGVVEELEVKVNGKTATFETDKFSTYALTYADTEKTSSPKTGDNITMYFIMFIVSLLGIRTLSVSNKRKSKRTRR